MCNSIQSIFCVYEHVKNERMPIDKFRENFITFFCFNQLKLQICLYSLDVENLCIIEVQCCIIAILQNASFVMRQISSLSLMKRKYIWKRKLNSAYFIYANWTKNFWMIQITSWFAQNACKHRFFVKLNLKDYVKCHPSL